MVKCCVPICSASSLVVNKLVSGIGFHSFPKDTKRIILWTQKIDRPNWEPNVYSRICSKHFSEDSFFITKNGLRRLRGNAIPTENLHRGAEESMQQERAKTPHENPIDEEVQLHPDDTPRQKNLKARVIRLEQIRKVNRRKLKTSHQRVNRLRKKLISTKKLLRELKNERNINKEQFDKNK